MRARVPVVSPVVLVPVAIGMAIRKANAALANKLDKPVRIVSAVFLVLVILAAVLSNRDKLVEYFQEVGLAAFAFNLASMLVGYCIPLLARVERRQAIAIGMEIGIHNGTLAIAIATTVLQNPTMSVPPVANGTINRTGFSG